MPKSRKPSAPPTDAARAEEAIGRMLDQITQLEIQVQMAVLGLCLDLSRLGVPLQLTPADRGMLADAVALALGADLFARLVAAGAPVPPAEGASPP